MSTAKTDPQSDDPKAKVLERYPKAYCADSRLFDCWCVRVQTPVSGVDELGSGLTESAAWADAARRISTE